MVVTHLLPLLRQKLLSQLLLNIQPEKPFWIMESVAFHGLTTVPVPPVLHLPVILDRVDLSSSKLNHLTKQSSSEIPDSESTGLAIVPFKPCLHVVLLQI